MQFNKDNQTVVDDHRNMLHLSKKISKFQEDNLKSWAFIFFDNVSTATVNWNFIKENENKDFYPGRIVFDIKFKENAISDSEKITLGVDRLEACTKFLFWKETKVTIKINGDTWKTSSLQKPEETLLLKN